MKAAVAEHEMSGIRRAAVLMVLLGEEAAAQIYRMLPERTVEAITAELATLNRITPESAEAVLEDYVNYRRRSNT